MKREVANNQYSPEETEQRVRAALPGAFRKGRTPLKAIPKRNGESRQKMWRQARNKP
jgi:hypothetical protein